MTIIKILAILGIVLGAVFFVADFKNRGRKSMGIFIALIVASAALLTVACLTEERFAQRTQTQPQAVVQQVPDTANPNDTTDTTDPVIALDLSDEPDDGVQQIPAQNLNDSNDNNDIIQNDDIDLRDDNDQNPENGDNAEQDPIPDDQNPDSALQPDAEAEVDELAPFANAGKDIDDGKVNEKILFSASKSRKNKSSLKTYHWDFGDGTEADGKEVSHIYGTAGSYTATLTITDSKGHIGKATRKVEINRPENKIRFVHQKLDDAEDVKSAPQILSGTADKTFSGSQIALEASGNIVSTSNCTCGLTVTVKGPGCDAPKTKSLNNGGEGDVSVKTSCKGEPGSYQWSVERTMSGSGCSCSWTGIKLDGFEN